MTGLVGRRLLTVPFVLLGAALLIFLLPRLAGVDTVRAVLRSRTAEAEPDPAVAARVTAELGLDRSWVEQFLRWLGHALRGDLGTSFATRTPIAPQLGAALEVSAVLSALALLVAAVVGIPLGVRAARRRGGLADRVVTAISVVGVAVPEFVLAPVLVLLLAIAVPLLPATGWGTPAQAVLPVLTLACFPVALAAQLTRAETLDALARPHVTVALAKGLGPSRLVWRHGARLALTGVTALSGMFFAGLLGGAVVVEVAFGIPGLGRLLYDSVIGQDLPMLQAGLLAVVAVAVVAGIGAEAVALALDPVARSEAEG
ncbi:ABC transporter permease [Pseudonocardia oroxyli]|uniref:Peptide/nickel transport system permease protein n=1 Tax=Pseudonocardia oroxyli TaxID=366584 RepID=A0A1G7L9P0_PSEOR|nr:ABC transporter permease [Pseudonocardia oroxyli]SDF46096.1 peptide/nickel transport system permease protein [Pseudonocardia oroxyli]